MESRTIRPKRSVRHAIAAAAIPPRPPNPSHQSRRARERRRNLRIIGAAGVVIILILLIPVYGYYREVIRLGDHTAATVDGKVLTVEQVARYTGTRQAFLGRQITAAQPTAGATVAPATSPSTPAATPVATNTPTAAEQTARQTLQTLQSEQSSMSSNGVNALVEASLILDESKTRNLTATQDELDNGLRWLLSPHLPDGSSGVDPVPASVPVTGTVSLALAQQDVSQIVGSGRFLSADQITELVVKPAVLKTKLIDALSTGPVAATADEVHARHILVATIEEAQAAKKQIDGGAKFEDVAAKVSTDTSNKDQGGDLGWFAKGQMVPEFEQAAFSLPVGQVSGPVKSQFGYHLIQVLEKDPNHPLDPARIQQLREQGYSTWASKEQSDPTRVALDPGSTNASNWIRDYISKPN